MKFVIDSEQAKRDLLHAICEIDVSRKPTLQVEIKIHINTRKNAQNAYYWGVVLREIANYTGYGCEELHEMFKDAFMPREILEKDGKSCEVIMSTTQLSTIEFNEYIEKCVYFSCDSLGVYIPLPNEERVNVPT